MVYIGRTRENEMFYGAKKETFEKARKLRKSLTTAERILWKKLRKNNIGGVFFRRQHPIDIYIVDFYCHEHKLVIEVDGEIHNDPENKIRDSARAGELQNYGITVIRFKNEEVINDIDNVIEKIKKALDKSGFSDNVIQSK